MTSQKLNEQDLLLLLKENARHTNKDLAALLNVSEKDVSKAISKLEKNGTIRQYTTIINEEKIKKAPTKIKALVEVTVQPEKNKGFENIARKVFKYENVINHYLVSGTFDFLLVVEGDSLQDISAFVSDKLSLIPNVRSTKTNFVLKKYKEAGAIIGEDNKSKRLAISP